MYLPYQSLVRLSPELFPEQTLRDDQFQPASIDLTVGEVDFDHAPVGMYLVKTRERVRMPAGYVGFLWGKQRLMRDGVLVGAGSGLIPPGWFGPLTVAMIVGHPNDVPELGAPFVQLAVAALTSPTERSYTRVTHDD